MTGAKGGHGRLLLWLVTGLFFVWGGATSLNDVLIPKLKGLYALSYAEVMLTQFAFFMGYFIFSLPAGWLISRIGYVRGLVAGLLVMAAGAALFWPATLAGAYWAYLVALFVLAGGITLLQVASNPLIAQAGDEAGASARLTFAQAFNSLGTTIWPYVGANLILGGAAASVDPAKLDTPALIAYRAQESAIVAHVYIGIAVVLAVIAIAFWALRDSSGVEKPKAVGLADIAALVGERRLMFGAAALFAYVGAEVAIGSLLVSYLQSPTTLALSPQSAGEHLAFYWGGAMVGRFVGSALLRIVPPPRLLLIFALTAIALIAISMGTTGGIAGWTLIGVGLFNSIMFPTIFSLALAGLEDRAAEGSGLLCMAIVGGAIVPLATGRLADSTGLATALILPIICYLVIAAFAIAQRRTVGTAESVTSH
jgi:FHS family L-fucose permease-like MFS transporter